MSTPSWNLPAVCREEHARRTGPSVVLVLSLLAGLCGHMHRADAQGDQKTGETRFFVSTEGSDAWSGKLAAHNAGKTDGPFASITRAREAIRELKAAQDGLRRPVTVQVRGGTYYISGTITLTPEDSGTKEHPITYTAYPGEKPVLCGGRRITGWRTDDGKIYYADLPWVKAGKWYFRQLFVDGCRAVRARFPNVHATDPCRKGFLYLDSGGGFGTSVACIHNRGDWMRYKIQAPADGTYQVWIYYGAQNAPVLDKRHRTTDMGGRTTITIDGGPPTKLMNLPDTGGWYTMKWTCSATVSLKGGPHVLEWKNIVGGGLMLNAFVLCDDPKWTPQVLPLGPVSPGTHRVVIQAEQFTASHGPQLRVQATSRSKTFIRCKRGTGKRAWAEAPHAQIHIFPTGCCRAFKQIVEIEAVEPDGSGIRIAGKECKADLSPGDRFFVENVREELDAPGEWYLDRARGRLYYWPAKLPLSESRVVAPVVGRLWQLLGDGKGEKPVSHVRISGFVIQETDYSPDDGAALFGMGREGAVHLVATRHCSIDGNWFVNVGKAGICAEASHHNQITHNEIAYGAEGGILLSESDGNIVSNNHIHHIGAVYKHVGGVVLQAYKYVDGRSVKPGGPEGTCCSNNVVCHNLIHDSSRYGITLKFAGRHNVIEYNEMYSLNTETYDTGGIEVTQHDKGFRSGSSIRYNIVHDVGGYSSDAGKAMFLSWGIYLDSYAGGYEVRNNIVYRNSHGGIMIQGGKDNNIHNNIFVGGTLRQMQFNNFADNSSGNRFFRNIVYYTASGADLLLAYRSAHKTIGSDYNLYCHAGGKSLTVRLGAGVPKSFSEWRQQGDDAHSIIADPLFVDPAKDNYSLRPDSPAFKLGFKPIDTTRIGLSRRPDPRPGD